MNIYEVLGILFIHWVADFVLQTDKQAKGKSKNMLPLLQHTGIYTLVWLIPVIIYMPGWPGYNFLCITFILHTITDYFTSRLNSKLWSQGKTHNFFVSVGFDQWLHYVQLFLTYLYLIK